MRLFLSLFFLLVCGRAAFAFGHPHPLPQREGQTAPPESSDWFTGPLITPSGHVVPAGYINPEPYVFYTVISAEYDKDWKSVSIPTFTTVNFQFPLFVGLTDSMNILVVPQALWNGSQGVSNLVFGDFIVELDYQALVDTPENHLPGIKFYVQEIFPTGKYRELDPEKFGTDLGGQGSFITRLGVVFTRVFRLSPHHALPVRWNLSFDLPSPIAAKGPGAYLGGPGTHGTIRGGQRLTSTIGVEYNLTRNWVLACDLVGTHLFKQRFSGTHGTDINGTPFRVARPEAFNFSLAPAIEYNFSASTGIIAGGWFSFAGQNSLAFYSGVIAINYYGPLPKPSQNRFSCGSCD